MQQRQKESNPKRVHGKPQTSNKPKASATPKKNDSINTASTNQDYATQVEKTIDKITGKKKEAF